MSELIYIDTNIWVDYFLNRKDRLRPIGDFAFELFRKSVSCMYIVIISDLLLEEIEKLGFSNEFNQTVAWLKQSNKIKYVDCTNSDFILAKKDNHWQDSLHAILAQKAKVKYLVTRNISDFSGVYSFEVKFPEFL